MSGNRLILVAGGLGIVLLGWQCAVWGQKKDSAEGKLHLEFDVVQSTDAKYLGDTPAHIGRIGEVRERPSIALGDSVYHLDSQERVGKVTSVEWNRAKTSIEVEITSEPFQRIAVGDRLWLWLRSNEKQAQESEKKEH